MDDFVSYASVERRTVHIQGADYYKRPGKYDSHHHVKDLDHVIEAEPRIDYQEGNVDESIEDWLVMKK